MPKVDPGHTRPIYFVGYSNGGRMAYRLECTDPSLFNGMVAVKADPMPGCVVTKPQNVLVFAALDDPVGAVQARGEGQGDAPGHGPDRPAADGPQVLQQADRRQARRHDPLHVVLRGREDARVGALSDRRPQLPAPERPATPGANQLIWSFISKTALAPVPS